MEPRSGNSVWARSALLPEGWVRDLRLSLHAGRIHKLETGVTPEVDDEQVAVLLPGMPNLHSPAFQRGRRG